MKTADLIGHLEAERRAALADAATLRIIADRYDSDDPRNTFGNRGTALRDTADWCERLAAVYADSIAKLDA
jgi:hypothetical protein